MPGYVRAEVPRWKKAANRRVLRSDAAKANLNIEFLEKFCLQSASTADVSAITLRFSFLRNFIVSHVNLEIERDFEDMDAQHTQLLKEMGAFRGQLSKLNSKVFNASDPGKGKMTTTGSKLCFRCKSEYHDVKQCKESRKRKAVLKSKVFEVPTDETPTPAQCVSEHIEEVVVNESIPVDSTPTNIQQVNPEAAPTQEEPAAQAQREHSTPVVEHAPPRKNLVGVLASYGCDPYGIHQRSIGPPVGSMKYANPMVTAPSADASSVDSDQPRQRDRRRPRRRGRRRKPKVSV